MVLTLVIPHAHYGNFSLLSNTFLRRQCFVCFYPLPSTLPPLPSRPSPSSPPSPPHTHPSSPSHLAFPSPLPSPFYHRGVVWWGVVWSKNVQILLKYKSVWRRFFVHPPPRDLVAEIAPSPSRGRKITKNIQFVKFMKNDGVWCGVVWRWWWISPCPWHIFAQAPAASVKRCV